MGAGLTNRAIAIEVRVFDTHSRCLIITKIDADGRSMEVLRTANIDRQLLHDPVRGRQTRILVSAQHRFSGVIVWCQGLLPVDQT